MLAEGGGDGTGDRVAQILNSRSCKGTLLQVDGEAMEVAEVKHTAEIMRMRGKKVGENKNVIKIDKTKWKITKYPVHHPLEGLGSVLEAKRKVKKFEEAEGSIDGGLQNNSYTPWNLEIIFWRSSLEKNLDPKILAEI